MHNRIAFKPLAAVTLMNNGIPSVHKAWWQRKSLDELHKLYMELTATPAKVLLQVIYTETSNLSETCLTQFIGDMKQEMVRRFDVSLLVAQCAWPGVSVLLLTNLLGFLGIHAVGHIATCSYTLELPTTYNSYPGFTYEFQQQLMQPENE